MVALRHASPIVLAPTTETDPSGANTIWWVVDSSCAPRTLSVRRLARVQRAIVTGRDEDRRLSIFGGGFGF